MSKQYGFMIDSASCVDCRACITACKANRQLELGLAWRKVITTWLGVFPNVTFSSQSMSCNHCAQPACVPACPVKAISKRVEDGIVIVDRDKCIGCGSCGKACPYGAPQYGKDGRMQKCDLCIDRLSAGKKPVCVSTCSANALAFGTMEELPSLVQGRPLKRLEGATGPSIYISEK